ncbi:MAG TPA: 2-amino-4-hydroxy-6-hydroxymethyldihydropteridine diphosphokinase [Polyangiaceae bacterium]|nr:2-amino-4-hydroxy-6-hydroxymethyldihydropteridine diphosphokinase [Polyangiaceae bacterium]
MSEISARSDEICTPLDAVVGLGSNLGDRFSYLRFAVRRLAELGADLRVSGIYETEPLGPPQPRYLNAAVRARFELSPRSLLNSLLEIERAAGRERRERWGARTLDLDLLWIAGVSVNEPDLRVPHPELTRRAFALAPLVELAPEATDPQADESYSERLARLDLEGVERLSVALWERG